ncbi:MAG: hypothetical protein SOX32_04705 [Candidatus Choladocola sp.]|nr:hypothetical protein [Candidatus Choladocola sp.]
MKVFKRILIKLIILLLVIGAAGGGAAGLQAYRQSTPEYTIERYLSSLIDNRSNNAFAMLDQSEDAVMTQEEYTGALNEKKYSLYAGFHLQEGEKKHDDSGNEYVDYHVEFLNAADEVQLEDDFTVKKQSKAVFGIFDQWKILSDHCMVKNFILTVPAGSEVYLDSEKADASWLAKDEVITSYDCYRIPTLIPGKISLVIRHPALESVNTVLDALDGSADYTDKMKMKKSSQDECKELGITVLKELYASSAKEKKDALSDVFDGCRKTAEDFVKKQGDIFHSDSADFKTAAVSDFAVKFSDLTFTEEKNGAITTEMTLLYHYVVKEEVTVDTDEVLEDGTPVQTTETRSQSGDNTAKLVMSFYDGAWHVASLDIPVIPAE